MSSLSPSCIFSLSCSLNMLKSLASQKKFFPLHSLVTAILSPPYNRQTAWKKPPHSLPISSLLEKISAYYKHLYCFLETFFKTTHNPNSSQYLWKCLQWTPSVIRIQLLFISSATILRPTSFSWFHLCLPTTYSSQEPDDILKIKAHLCYSSAPNPLIDSHWPSLYHAF